MIPNDWFYNKSYSQKYHLDKIVEFKFYEELCGRKKKKNNTEIKPERKFLHTRVIGKTCTTCLNGKQEPAEQVVANILRDSGDIHRLYNNIYLWNEDKSKIYQVDHIAIGRNYIYVIETKDVYGVPYIGTKTEEYWGVAPNIDSHIYDFWYQGK